MKQNHLLIAPLLFGALLLFGCGTQDSPTPVIPEDAQAGDLGVHAGPDLLDHPRADGVGVRMHVADDRAVEPRHVAVQLGPGADRHES